MKSMTLYTGAGKTLSPRRENGMTEAKYVRLIAEDGMAVSNGSLVLFVADVPAEEVALWRDCDAPQQDEVPDATAHEILNIILGGDGE